MKPQKVISMQINEPNYVMLESNETWSLKVSNDGNQGKKNIYKDGTVG